MKKIALSLLLAFVHLIAFSQEIGLELNLKVGKDYKLILGNKVLTNMNFGERNMENEITLIYSHAFKVIDFKDNIYTLQVSIDSLRAEFNTVGQESVTINTETSDTSAISKFMNNLKLVKFDVLINKWGETLEIKRDSATFNKLFESSVSKSNRNLMRYSMQARSIFDEEAIKSNFDLLFNIFPKNYVNEGDTWTKKSKTNISRSECEMESIFELSELGNDYAIIRSEHKISPIVSSKEGEKKTSGENSSGQNQSTIAVQVQASGSNEVRVQASANQNSAMAQGGRGNRQAGNFRMNMQMDGYFYCEYKIDLNTGWILSSTIEEEVVGSMELPKMGENQGPTSMSVSVKGIFQAFGEF